MKQLHKRKKIINRKFQLKTTFTLFGIIIIAFISITAITGVIATDNNKKILGTIHELKESIEREDNIIKAFIKFANESAYSSFYTDTNTIKIDHEKTMTVIKDHIELLYTFVEQNKLLITVMIGIGIVLTMVLYFYIIRLTNRISGPIYVISQHIDDIMNGKEPDFRSLRKNDEFKEFYDQFVKMIEEIKKK